MNNPLFFAQLNYPRRLGRFESDREKSRSFCDRGQRQTLSNAICLSLSGSLLEAGSDMGGFDKPGHIAQQVIAGQAKTRFTWSLNVRRHRSDYPTIFHLKQDHLNGFQQNQRISPVGVKPYG